MTEIPFREARIDTEALRSNFEILRSHVAPAAAMAVVKADAYGHGMVLVARAVVEAGAEWLGVTDLDEAMVLRSAGIRQPVLAWLHGTDADFATAIAAGVDLGLSSLDQLERVAALGGAVVQLKVDTGLSRNGIAPDDVERVFGRAAELERSGRVRVRGVFSHLSNTSRADDTRQLELFDRVLEAAQSAGLDPELRHIASSQAGIERPEARYDLVRLGVALYGLPPADAVDTAALGLRPVMELAGSIAAVRRVPAGSGVSYGYTHRTERETTLALVPLGYADGVPRAASDRGRVWIGGEQYPVVGRIAMDQFLVDVGDASVAVGDRVVIWGDPATGVPGAQDWAVAAGTIGYEIVTRVGPRVPRTSRP